MIIGAAITCRVQRYSSRTLHGTNACTWLPFRLNPQEFWRLIKDCGVSIKPHEPTQHERWHVDEIFQQALRASALLPPALHHTRQWSLRGVSVAVDDSSLGMGLMSFLASLVLVAAASCPAPAPGAVQDQGQMAMAAALATLAKEHLLPRTCTLLFLWRQPCHDSSA